MPKETDRERLDLLARTLLHPKGWVDFREQAFVGKPDEPDNIGLNGVVGTTVPIIGRERMLREALADFLRAGGVPNRVEIAGDERGDPETRYEFRFELAGTRVYVYLVLDLEEPDDPHLIVKKVARWN